MKGTNIGEFEELVLLTIVLLQDDAYSVAICDQLDLQTGRKAKLGVVHSVLNRLETKGFIKSRLGEPTSERGGRRKRFYQLTNTGKASVREAREIRERLWNAIPKLAWENLVS